jgi:UDP-galactopyranose mutase
VAYDYLIVGAGFAGSVCARQLADAGKRVLVIDKRDHIGGNAYDYVNEHGVRIHKYGPHIFHTNSDKVFDWLSRFTEWRPYEHRVLAAVEGKLVPFPINLTTLEMLGLEGERGDDTITHPANAEEQCLQRVGRKLYELFFEGYTTKMWGRHPRELDASVTARIPVRWDSRDDRYFTDKHQAMPRDGYTAMFERMLDHPGIKVRLSCSHQWANGGLSVAAPTVWTGQIDQFFSHRFDPLPYRSMRFDAGDMPTSVKHDGDPRAATVNHPNAHLICTRITDMGKLTSTADRWTRLVVEIPCAEGEPYYPIPTPENRALYKRYEALAAAEPNVTFLGRLGCYQYLNMDQVVGQALMVSERLLAANPARS